MQFSIGLTLLVLAVIIAIPSFIVMRKSAKDLMTATVEEAKLSEETARIEDERNSRQRNSRDSYSSYSTSNPSSSSSKKRNSPTTILTNTLKAAKFGLLTSAALGFLSLVFILPAMFYTQDVGESKVQVSWTGDLIGQTTETGLHFKAPWVNVKTFDIRNNLVAYVADGTTNYSGNKTTGPQVTFQDREGVTGNMDITLRYSLAPDSVLAIYSDFRTQDAFVTRVISEGIRAEARLAPSTKNTIEVYNDRQGVAQDIWNGLETRWGDLGIIIEDVAVQEIRYSPEVISRFDDAQSARIAIDKAEADKEAALVQADTAVIQAQGRADAQVVEAQGQAESNDILTQSLSEEILTQRYIDALQTGTVFVVPEGSTPFITANK